MMACQITSLLMTSTSLPITSKILQNLPLFTHQYHSTNRVIKDFLYIWKQELLSEEIIFNFLKQSIDQLSRNVRLCQKK